MAVGMAAHLGRRSRCRPRARLRLHCRSRRFVIATSNHVVKFTIHPKFSPEFTRAIGHLREASLNITRALDAYQEAINVLHAVADADEGPGTCPVHDVADCVCSGYPDFVIAYAPGGYLPATPTVNDCPTLDAPAGHVDHECCCDGCCPTDGSGGDGG